MPRNRKALSARQNLSGKRKICITIATVEYSIREWVISFRMNILLQRVIEYGPSARLSSGANNSRWLGLS